MSTWILFTIFIIIAVALTLLWAYFLGSAFFMSIGSFLKSVVHSIVHIGKE